MEQGYFQKGQAAKYLGISFTTFWRWCKKYGIKAHDVDGLILFARTDLDRFMKSKEIK